MAADARDASIPRGCRFQTDPQFFVVQVFGSQAAVQLLGAFSNSVAESLSKREIDTAERTKKLAAESGVSAELYFGPRLQTVPMRALTPNCVILDSNQMDAAGNSSSSSHCPSGYIQTQLFQSSIDSARWTSHWLLPSSHFARNTT